MTERADGDWGRHVSAGSCASTACLDGSQRRAGLEPDILGQATAGGRARTQRVGLSLAPVQRGRQLPPEALAKRMHRHECMQFADQSLMTAIDQFGINPVLDRAEPQFVEPNSLGFEEATALRVGQGCTTPQTECLSELGRRARVGRRRADNGVLPREVRRTGWRRRQPARPRAGSRVRRTRAVRWPIATDSTLRISATRTCTTRFARSGNIAGHSSSDSRSTDTTSPQRRASEATRARDFGDSRGSSTSSIRIRSSPNSATLTVASVPRASTDPASASASAADGS